MLFLSKKLWNAMKFTQNLQLVVKKLWEFFGIFTFSSFNVFFSFLTFLKCVFLQFLKKFLKQLYLSKKIMKCTEIYTEFAACCQDSLTIIWNFYVKFFKLFFKDFQLRKMWFFSSFLRSLLNNCIFRKKIMKCYEICTAFAACCEDVLRIFWNFCVRFF